MPNNQQDTLEEARSLIKEIEDYYNQISYFHRLVEIAGDLESVDDIRLILDAYLSHNKSFLEELGSTLILLREAIKVK